MEEEWRVIPGFEDYAVSNLGSVKRMRPSKSNGKWKIGQELKPCLNKYGYFDVILMKDCKQYHNKIHTLVALAFLGPCPVGKEVNHKDFNTRNNSPSNLEYLTRLENIRHSLKNGRYNKNHESTAQRIGEKGSRSKIKNCQIGWIRILINQGIPYKDIAEIFIVSRRAISSIADGSNWSRVHSVSLGGPQLPRTPSSDETGHCARLGDEKSSQDPCGNISITSGCNGQ